ncbi:polysaccharide biosynthesis C-terminal domain-containing protein [Ekhidna sp.]|uniref:oligosaccharide flippase family protein n=1 Tax=Ekhidna sp. TaxID=2608089 RepID=UPI003B5A9DB4
MINLKRLKDFLGEDLSYILSGAFFTFVFRSFGAAISFFMNIIVAREIGADGIGSYHLVLTLSTVFSTIALLGFNNLLTKIVPQFVLEQVKISSLFTRAVKYSFGTSLIISLILWLVSYHQSINGNLEIALRFTSLSVGAMTIIPLSADYLRALLRPRISAIFQSFLIPSLLFGVVLILKSTNQLNVNNFLISYCLIASLISLVSFIVSIKISPRYQDIISRKIPLFNESKKFYYIKLVNIPLRYSDVLILSIMVSAVDLGIYTTSLRYSVLLQFVLLAFSLISAPKISLLLSKENWMGLKQLIRRVSLGIVIITLPVTLFCLLFPQFAMGVFGKEFLAGSPVLVILTLGQIVNMGTGVVGTLLTYSGNQSDVLKVNGVSGVLNILASIPLIHYFGILGAAISSSLFLVLGNLAQVILVYRKFGFYSFPLLK